MKITDRYRDLRKEYAALVSEANMQAKCPSRGYDEVAADEKMTVISHQMKAELDRIDASVDGGRQFVLIRDTSDAYYAEESIFCEDQDQLIEHYQQLKSGDFVAAYRVSEVIDEARLKTIVADRKRAHEEAVAAAKAKLTPEECKLLGIA